MTPQSKSVVWPVAALAAAGAGITENTEEARQRSGIRIRHLLALLDCKGKKKAAAGPDLAEIYVFGNRGNEFKIMFFNKTDLLKIPPTNLTSSSKRKP
jgi:hypothetical protein